MKTKSFMIFSLFAIFLSAIGAISLSTSQSIFAQNTTTPLGPSTTIQSMMAAKGNQNAPLGVNNTIQSMMAAKGNQNAPLGVNNTIQSMMAAKGNQNAPLGVNNTIQSMVAAKGNQNAMVNGSINVVKSIYQSIASKFNVTLDQAINTAQKAIGNKSYALSASTSIRNGYITYSIFLGTPDMKFYHVIVDPGNGKILSSHQLPLMTGMMSMHSGIGMNNGMMMGPGMGINNGWNDQNNNYGQ